MGVPHVLSFFGFMVSPNSRNTKNFLDAIAAVDPEVDLVDVTPAEKTDLSGYDRIGFASGIYYSSFAKQVITFAAENLPEGKLVFFIYTHGVPAGGFLKGIRAVTQSKQCKELGEYRCQSFDTFSPFKLVGGIAKGHPTKAEIDGAVKFYWKLPEK